MQASVREFVGDGELPRWLWLWMPLLLLVLPMVVGFTAPEFYNRVFETEFGLIENIQVAFLFVALLIALTAARLAWQASSRAQVLWLSLFASATFFYLGEEVSWGQHFIGWQADGIFAERGQAETNIHNLHPFLSRALRAIVVTAIVLVGLLPITPLGAWLCAKLPGGLAFWLWALPSKNCSLTALLILGVKLPKRIYRWSGLEEGYWPGINDNELLEVFVAAFFFLYALVLLRRIKYHLRDRS